MSIAFTKMHGCGNDYVVVDVHVQTIADPPTLAQQVSRRHFSVGSDGLITVGPSERAHVRMRMWNADGSEAQRCGNGIRQVAKLAWEAGYASAPEPGQPVTIEVGRPGSTEVVSVAVTVVEGLVERATVDMGPPAFERAALPMVGDGCATDLALVPDARCSPALAAWIAHHDRTLTALSMGNPHAVVFVAQPPTDDVVSTLGPWLEHHPWFPERTNVPIAFVQDAGALRLRVWERGSGETLACGTGACAALVAAVRTGRISGREARVVLPGGDLVVRWPTDHGSVFLDGPVDEVFRGQFGLR